MNKDWGDEIIDGVFREVDIVLPPAVSFTPRRKRSQVEIDEALDWYNQKVREYEEIADDLDNPRHRELWEIACPFNGMEPYDRYVWYEVRRAEIRGERIDDSTWDKARLKADKKYGVDWEPVPVEWNQPLEPDPHPGIWGYFQDIRDMFGLFKDVIGGR